MNLTKGFFQKNNLLKNTKMSKIIRANAKQEINLGTHILSKGALYMLNISINDTGLGCEVYESDGTINQSIQYKDIIEFLNDWTYIQTQDIFGGEVSYPTKLESTKIEPVSFLKSENDSSKQ